MTADFTPVAVSPEQGSISELSAVAVSPDRGSLPELSVAPVSPDRGSVSGFSPVSVSPESGDTGSEDAQWDVWLTLMGYDEDRYYGGAWPSVLLRQQRAAALAGRADAGSLARLAEAYDD